MKRIGIEIDDGIIEIEVNGDANRVFKFASRDMNVFDKFMSFEAWMKTYGVKMLEELSKFENVVINEDGSINANDYELGLITKSGNMINEKIDEVFGKDAHKAAFGGVNPITTTKGVEGMLFVKFMEILTPIMFSAWDENGVAEANEVNKTAHLAKAHAQKKARQNQNNRPRGSSKR